MKLNFREVYRGQYQQIAPDARLLEATEELLCERLYAPRKRFLTGRRVAAVAGICLMLAVSPKLGGLLDNALDSALDNALVGTDEVMTADITADVAQDSFFLAQNGDLKQPAAGGQDSMPAVLENQLESKSEGGAGDIVDDGEPDGLMGDCTGAQANERLKVVDDEAVLELSLLAGLTEDIAFCALPKAPDAQELTEAELYALTEYAGLLPVAAPQGYVLESAELSGDEDGTVLLVSWTQGYDYIRMVVRPVEDVDAAYMAECMVDITRPEMWDLEHYAGMLVDGQPRYELWQLVPEELYYAVHYPVFAREDFTAEVLGKRCSPSDDEGHYYGHFGLLCGDMLVEYTVRSDDLAAVFAAISSARDFSG